MLGHCVPWTGVWVQGERCALAEPAHAGSKSGHTTASILTINRWDPLEGQRAHQAFENVLRVGAR